MTESSRWISNNLCLTGLDVERSPFMVCKELVENSLDAVRSIATGVVEIRLECLDDVLEITCSDNGSCFEPQSVTAIHKVFESHRGPSNGHVSCGKFGVGMKAMALLCSKHCSGRCLSVRTVVGVGTESPYHVSFQVSADANGNISICEPELSGGHNQVGDMHTFVTAYAPLGTNSITKISQDITCYLRALTRSQPRLDLKLFIDDEIIPIPIPCCISESQLCDPSGIFDCSLSIERVDLSPDSTPYISILRYVNGAPLITPGSSLNNCGLLAGTVTGLLRICSSLGIEIGISQPVIKSIVEWSLPISNVPQESTWNSLTVSLSVSCSSKDVQYPSLCKSAVVGVGSSTSLERLVSRCVIDSMKKFQKRIPSQFQSPDDHEYKKAISHHIPVIAYNLAQVFRRSRADTSSSDLTQLLNIAIGSSEDYEGMIIKNLSDALGPPRNRKVSSSKRRV